MRAVGGPGSAGRARPRRADLRLASPVLAAAVAATLAIAALLRADSPGDPATSPIAPLRVQSGHEVATGFAVADGRVVTVAHVIGGPVTVGGRPARVLRMDRQTDLALLAAPGFRAAAPEITGASDGERVRAVRLRAGSSSALWVHVRRSIVAHVRAPGVERVAMRPALELSARVAPGDSGAPVLSDEGELAGVIFAASRTRADTAYAVDASRVRQLLR